MNGLNNLSRRVSPQEMDRRHKAPKYVTTNAAERVDIGDWSLAVDENGALVIHNVMTGKRITLARA